MSPAQIGGFDLPHSSKAEIARSFFVDPHSKENSSNWQQIQVETSSFLSRKYAKTSRSGRKQQH